MNNTISELQQEIHDHRRNILSLLDEAKKIQQEVRKLPLVKRQAAMKEVVSLEMEAVAESQKVTSLELGLLAIKSEDINRQKSQFINTELFLINNY